MITGQTQGIVKNISARFPKKDVLWVPNGVDFTALKDAGQAPASDIRNRLGIAPDALLLAYAGILGHAQGLHVILQAAALLHDRKDIHFMLVGDGPEKERLLEMKQQLDPVNVHFVDRMPRRELLAMMRSIDAVVVPLLRNALFKGAIPSKIFEALALRKPVLLGVDGEARELFIEQGRAGLYFEPESAPDLARVAAQYAGDRALVLEQGAHGESYVMEHFDRQVISKKLWDAIQQLA